LLSEQNQNYFAGNLGIKSPTMVHLISQLPGTLT